MRHALFERIGMQRDEEMRPGTAGDGDAGLERDEVILFAVITTLMPPARNSASFTSRASCSTRSDSR